MKCVEDVRALCERYPPHPTPTRPPSAGLGSSRAYAACKTNSKSTGGAPSPSLPWSGLVPFRIARIFTGGQGLTRVHFVQLNVSAFCGIRWLALVGAPGLVCSLSDSAVTYAAGRRIAWGAAGRGVGSGGGEGGGGNVEAAAAAAAGVAGGRSRRHQSPRPAH